jgi:hypothetical protein
MKVIRGWSVVYVSLQDGEQSLVIHSTKQAADDVLARLRNICPGRQDIEVRPVAVDFDESVRGDSRQTLTSVTALWFGLLSAKHRAE